MDVKLVICPHGAGGNFLSRILTLDKTVFPMGDCHVNSSPKFLVDYYKYDTILSNYNAKGINLSNIINSDESFLNEYYKLCDLFKITVYEEYALSIYHSWKKTWAI